MDIFQAQLADTQPWWKRAPPRWGCPSRGSRNGPSRLPWRPPPPPLQPWRPRDPPTCWPQTSASAGWVTNTLKSTTSYHGSKCTVVMVIWINHNYNIIRPKLLVLTADVFLAEKSQQWWCLDKACTGSYCLRLPDEEDSDHGSHLRSCWSPPSQSVR